MKKKTALSKLIITSIFSITVNVLLFVSLFYNLKDAEYSNLGFSIYIILFSIVSIIVFVISVTLNSPRRNILYLAFCLYFFIGLALFILASCWYVENNGIYLVLSIINLSFASCYGTFIYKKLKLLNKPKI